MNDSDRTGVHSQAIGLLSRSRNIALIAGIVFLIIGAVFAFRPTETITVFAVLVAIAIFCIGFLEIADAFADRGSPHWGWALVRGLFHFVIGGILIFWPDITKVVVALLVGIDLVVDGIMAFVTRSRMPQDWPGRGSMAVRGVLQIVVGLVFLIFPEKSLVLLTYLLAAYLIVLGIVLILAARRLTKAKAEAGAG